MLVAVLIPSCGAVLDNVLFHFLKVVHSIAFFHVSALELFARVPLVILHERISPPVVVAVDVVLQSDCDIPKLGDVVVRSQYGAAGNVSELAPTHINDAASNVHHCAVWTAGCIDNGMTKVASIIAALAADFLSRLQWNGVVTAMRLPPDAR